MNRLINISFLEISSSLNSSSRNIYRSELDKTCLQHSMACGDFKDLPRRTASDKLLCEKAFKIGSNPKYDRYQRGLASMIYKSFDIKAGQTEMRICENQELTNELHKPIIRKFKKRKIYLSY